MNFDPFNFDPRIVIGIAKQGFDKPTPIQVRAIPEILNKRDMLAVAQTGTGKTAAFILPILERLISGPRKRIRSLIITPTRELAFQVNEVIRCLGRATGIKSTVIFGGVPMPLQISSIKEGVEIVVACPGRLLDHIGRGTIDLSDVEMFILDEADRMFDMGFLPAIRQIVEHLPRKRQTLLFSATMPDDIRRLAENILHLPVSVEVGRKALPAAIEHSFYSISHDQKTQFLLELFRQIEASAILVFTRTKHRAKRLADRLSASGYKAANLQGNLSQKRRREVMEGFRKGKYKILVATDIAARGIDVSAISHVINFDVPSTAETYTHRIGRTGRATRSGRAFTLVTEDDNRIIRDIERLIGKRLEQRELKGFAYNYASLRQKEGPQVLLDRPKRNASKRSLRNKELRNRYSHHRNRQGSPRSSKFRSGCNA